jgi:hypothetical protein
MKMEDNKRKRDDTDVTRKTKKKEEKPRSMLKDIHNRRLPQKKAYDSIEFAKFFKVYTSAPLVKISLLSQNYFQFYKKHASTQ